jgi:hypothetical protein
MIVVLLGVIRSWSAVKLAPGQSFCSIVGGRIVETEDRADAVRCFERHWGYGEDATSKRHADPAIYYSTLIRRS